MRRLIQVLLAGVVLFFVAGSVAAQTGTITGTVTDAATGEALPGVNVVVVGTQQGATTGATGDYTILNVSPGTYDVRASFVGYAPLTKQGVRVNIDLTTEVDFEMQEQTEQLQEVTVQAEEPVVKRDLSASRMDVSAEDIENLPVTGVEDIVSLQAGVQGLSVRGGGSDEVSFRIDGASMNSTRDSNPYTDVSYTSVKEIQVQTGGFNAEYGNIRSGLINVVTREGPRNRYTSDLLVRYRPPNQKHFGPTPNDQESYWVRPYLDPQVAMEGTGEWDEWTRRQFPDFRGFIRVAQETLQDDDASNDLTPYAAQQLFRFRHRRVLDITQPDYVVDGSFGGPVPAVSSQLGDLRFFASYRRNQETYIVPLSRRGYRNDYGRLKLTSNITPRMKLDMYGMLSVQQGTQSGHTYQGTGTTVRRDDRLSTRTSYMPVGFVRDLRGVAFAPDGLSVTDIDRNMLGADFTHTLSENTFYEAGVKRYETGYTTGPIRPRSDEIVAQFANREVGEDPFGYQYDAEYSITGMYLGAHNSMLRDTTSFTQWDIGLDITSQVHPAHQIKGGVGALMSNQDVLTDHIDALVDPPDTYTNYNKSSIYGSAYLQDKIEFQSMVANLGVRLDYFDPNVQWYSLEQPYADAFMGKNVDNFDEMMETNEVSPQLSINPRLGVSFPVTDQSKFYFNYGHFEQTPTSETLYAVVRTHIDNRVYQISNPYAPPPRTVAYELGFEQGLFDQFLVRLAGYYKDISNQTRWIRYEDRKGLIDFTTNVSTNYQDIRGFEVSLYKNAGRWVRGFVNYTYTVVSEGNFGFGEYFQDRFQQRQYERETQEHYQYKPLPQPYARFNVDFLTPPEFGPSLMGIQVLGDWRLSFLGRWQAGGYFTWTGEQSVPGVENNMQWPSYRMVDMRLAKNVNAWATAEVQLFVDVNNVFNIKNFNTAAFQGANDFRNYMETLRFPKEIADTIPEYSREYGDDMPGDLDADYIDPPNANSLLYLWPRDFYFGTRVSF